MEKKMKSKPMQKILECLGTYNDMHIIEFEEEMILKKDIEEWPVIDALVCFYSAGFPIDKTLKYTNKYKPI